MSMVLELWGFEGAPDLQCPHNLILKKLNTYIFQSWIWLIHGSDVVRSGFCHSPIRRSKRLKHGVVKNGAPHFQHV